MIYKIYKINNIEEKKKGDLISDITEINWSNAKFDDLNISFDFTTANSYLKPNDCVGLFAKTLAHTDDINFGEKIVFYGIITKKEIIQTPKDASKGLYKYSGYDFGYLLGKKTVTGQSKNAHPIDAIKKICAEIGIKPGKILKAYENDKSLTVTKIYKQETALNVLNEIYKLVLKSGLKDEYYYDFMDGRLNLVKYEKNNNLKGYIANAFTMNSLKTIYGQTITQTYDEKEKTMKDEINLNIIGNYNMKKGVIFDLKNEELNLDGEYLIETSNHTISGVKEGVNIRIRKIPKLEEHMDTTDTRFV